MTRIGIKETQRIRKGLRKNWYVGLTLLEILIFAAGILLFSLEGEKEYIFTGTDLVLYSGGEESAANVIEAAEGETYFLTPSVGLRPDIYQVKVYYQTDSDKNSCDVLADGRGAYSVYSDHVMLAASDNCAEYDFWANNRLDGMRLKIGYGNSGRLAVDRVEIRTAWNSIWYRGSRLLAFLAAVNLLVLLWERCKKGELDRVVLLGIVGTAILASCGVLGEYYTNGQELEFHLHRIEGLKDGILAGQFPVRIQTDWLGGWGYPVSVMCGDLTILLPALLRIAGFTVQGAYKYFVFAINLGTAGIAYYSFKRISSDKYIGLIGSILYTLSIYRMYCLYIKSAVDEYSALMFLPLAALGIYYALVEDPEEPGYGHNWLAPVLGITGLLQTHMLTARIAGIFAAAALLVGFRRTIRTKTLCYLGKVTGIAALLNLWFMVPYIQYMGENLNAAVIGTGGKIQRQGATWMELLAPIFNGNVAGSHGNDVLSLGNKTPIALGTAFLIVLILYLAVSGSWKTQKLKRPAALAFFLSGLSLYMATNLFPYDRLSFFSEKLSGLAASAGVPYRYLSIGSLLCTVLGCFVLMDLQERWNGTYVRTLSAVLCLLAVLQGTAYVYEILLYQGGSFRYDSIEFDPIQLNGGDYLYANSDIWTCLSDQSEGGQGIEVLSYEKEADRMKIALRAKDKQAYLTVPAFYYPGYEARDCATGEHLEVGRSEENNRIYVNIPEGYDGVVEVRFGKRVSWRFAEVISFVAFMVIGFSLVCKNMWQRIMGTVRAWGKSLEKAALPMLSILEDWNKKSAPGVPYGRRASAMGVCLMAVVAAGAGIILLKLNFMVSWTSDDFMYHFFFTDGLPGNVSKMKIWEVIPSMLNHRIYWNGRVIAHGLLQVVLLLGQKGFRIFNTLMFVALGVLIYLHAAYGKKRSASLLILIYVCLWFFLPQFGMTVLWASGAANYLWMAVLILSFTLLYRVEFSTPGKIGDTWRNAVLVGALGLLAGCSNENTGCAAIFLGILLTGGGYVFKRRTIPKWAFGGILEGIVGYLFLLGAPVSSARITSSVKTDLDTYLNRMGDLFHITVREFGSLFIMIGIAGALYIFCSGNKAGKIHKIAFAVMYFLTSLVSVAVLTFSNNYPDRAWFLGSVMLIVVLAWLYSEFWEHARLACGVLSVMMLLFFAVSFLGEYPKLQNTWRQVKEEIELIEAAVEEGADSVEIPIVKPSDSIYDAYNGTGYLKEAADDWVNAWMARYYGIAAIYGYEKKD